MAYDWRQPLPEPEGSAEYFDEVDRRFFVSSPFYRGNRPFERLIPFDDVVGRDVLEVGCGLGSHAQLLTEAGARYTGIDLTERAVALTTERLDVRGLQGQVLQMDAEQMAFPDNSFDFVWSWGVIHHSSRPESILREMYRVLRPGGKIKLMVYHARSLTSFANVVRGTVTGKCAQGMTRRDVMSHYVDGFVAQHYTQPEFRRALEAAGFDVIGTMAMGQKVELLPIPGVGPLGRAKQAAVRVVPDGLAEEVLSRYGWFLFASARKPGAPSSRGGRS